MASASSAGGLSLHPSQYFIRDIVIEGIKTGILLPNSKKDNQAIQEVLVGLLNEDDVFDRVAIGRLARETMNASVDDYMNSCNKIIFELIVYAAVWINPLGDSESRKVLITTGWMFNDNILLSLINKEKSLTAMYRLGKAYLEGEFDASTHSSISRVRGINLLKQFLERLNEHNYDASFAVEAREACEKLRREFMKKDEAANTLISKEELAYYMNIVAVLPTCSFFDETIQSFVNTYQIERPLRLHLAPEFDNFSGRSDE